MGGKMELKNDKMMGAWNGLMDVIFFGDMMCEKMMVKNGYGGWWYDEVKMDERTMPHALTTTKSP